LLVYAATTTLAAIVGVWLFYVQHQFEGTHWSRNVEWQMHDAALHGSSHYDLPTVLRWITGNIGIHHVHHLNSRIPLYRLWDTMRDHPELKSINRLTLWDSFRTVGLHLWDEANGRMVSFSEAKVA
ncbi:MAG: fatty acid desaturase, partial [Pseudomonadota bacterium]